MSGSDMLYLSRADVERAGVTMAEIVRAVEEMFREKGEGRTQMPPKTGIYPVPGGFMNAMPAFLPKTGAAGIKWVGMAPDNFKKNLPSISALLILNHAETGFPECVMDATWITAKRTAAASVVAAKYLARAESETLGVIGCGVQGYGHLEALREFFPICCVKAFDIRPAAAADFARRAEEFFGVDVEVVASAAAAARDCDLVVTAGTILKNPRPVLGEKEFARGAFVSAVDYDSVWTGEAMRAVDIFVMDDLAQMASFRDQGYFRSLPPGIGELSDLVTGRIPGRTRPEERTMAMNMGIALDDLAVAPLVAAKARALGLGVRLPL
ncbi:MAG: ornithine cyclodeaminase family protein [Candidatus Aminicenantes bacterium]|nr:ornithine cyclodeaminase family protein [Candidatus Aminicenantes bacterium]